MSNFSDLNHSPGLQEVIPYSHLLSDIQKSELEKNLNRVNYGQKELIFRQNTRTSHIMFVKSGLIKIFKNGRNERNLILKVATVGEFIGLMSIFGDKVHQYSAAAITEAEICDIDITVFKNVLMENGKYALQFMNLLSNDGLFIFDRLLGQSHKQLPGKIADVILYFSEYVFHDDHFTFPLTRKELADFAGTTKESFIRTLAEFRNDKIIDIDGSNIRINSIEIIKTLSNLG